MWAAVRTPFIALALGCRQVINAEPSTGMGSEFMRLAAEAGISNATWHQTDWNDAEGIQGDVVITADVTYFVREIVPFLQKLAATAGRRVIIAVWSIPPPNRSIRLFRLVHGGRTGTLSGSPGAAGRVVGNGHSPRCKGAT